MVPGTADDMGCIGIAWSLGVFRFQRFPTFGCVWYTIPKDVSARGIL